MVCGNEGDEDTDQGEKYSRDVQDVYKVDVAPRLGAGLSKGGCGTSHKIRREGQAKREKKKRSD